MGYVYGELLKAKREIKEAFGNMERNYKEVMAIVDKKMKNRLDSPLHVAAYMLNPYYSYNNPAIFSDSIVVEKFMQCVETFYYGEDGKEYRTVNEDLEKFQKRHGSFSKKMARSCERFEFNPGKLLHHSVQIIFQQSILSRFFCNQFCTCLIQFTSFCSILVEALWRRSTRSAKNGY